MALYRNISIKFWTDMKVDDDFSPEDKYFFLYLLTNPHTNICGCYEISVKQMSRETGYNDDTIKRLIKRMETVHKVIIYDYSTKEMFIVNWSKYNWSNSEKLTKAVIKVAENIKNKKFKNIINQLVNKEINIADLQYTVTDTVTDTDTVTESAVDTDVSIGYSYPIDTLSKEPAEQPKPQKHKFGEYHHVLLTDAEYEKLLSDYGQEVTEKYIKKVDEYCEQSGKRYKNYNLAIRNTFMSRDNIVPKSQKRDIFSLPEEELTEQEKIIKRLTC